MEGDIIAALSAQASSLSYMLETLMMRKPIASLNPISSISCVYCKGSHSFDNCPYNPDSLCYGFLPRFTNQHQYQCFQQGKMIPKEPSIEELAMEYRAKNDVVMKSQATSLRSLEIHEEQIADELQNRFEGSLIKDIETSKQEKEECEVVSLRTEVEHKDLELQIEARSAPTIDYIKEPKGREETKEKPPQEEKEEQKEVVVSHIVAIPPQLTSKVLPILECPTFAYYSLQEMQNQEECRNESIKDGNMQSLTQIATVISTFRNICKSLKSSRPVVIKAPQLRLKSRPTSRPRCKMKEHNCGLLAGIG